MAGLRTTTRLVADYRNGSYSPLPFRFGPLDDRRYVLTNLPGDYVVLERDALVRLVNGSLLPEHPDYPDLEGRLFLTEGDPASAVDLTSTQLRTKFSTLPELTGLFMFILTLRCEHSCGYCQVSRRMPAGTGFDMSPTQADAAVDLMFESPSPRLKVEFQGGEPLLAFPLLQRIVRRTLQRNETEGRSIAFVVATNLALLEDEHLQFFAAHDITVSTSLDGPRELHNANRPRPGADSFERTLAGIERVRQALGPDSVSALMTTTRASLGQVREIIDTYASLGLREVFLRPPSPFGFAVRTGLSRAISPAAWLTFYEEGLEHILALNRAGITMRESYTTLLLRRMLSPFPTGYVDLQSPAGLGLSCLAFNYDGGIYASDESRMLAETHDQSFRLGELGRTRFLDILRSERLLPVVDATLLEGAPMCTDCPFLPWCGADPVYHHATQRDVLGHKALSDFCQRHLGVFRSLVRRLEDAPADAAILRSWA